MTTARLALGIDLGGTKIEGALVALDGGTPRTLRRERIATDREDGYDAIVARVASFARGLVAREGTASFPPVGVGMPGSVSRRTGLVKNSNTVCLNGRPFRADLASALGAGVAFANDADCFALAEARLGAARGYDNGVVFGVILGTGVGGGWVLRGRTWAGAQGIAGEWGHHTLEPRGLACYCGRFGCVERYLAGPAIEEAYAKLAGEHRALIDIARRRDTDPHARRVLDNTTSAFGRALGNVISIVDPDVIVLGGGVSNLDCLYDEGRRAVARNVFNDELLTPIVRAELGDSAGVFGAALLALAGDLRHLASWA